jgi:ribosomal protein L32E
MAAVDQLRALIANAKRIVAFTRRQHGSPNAGRASDEDQCHNLRPGYAKSKAVRAHMPLFHRVESYLVATCLDRFFPRERSQAC